MHVERDYVILGSASRGRDGVLADPLDQPRKREGEYLEKKRQRKNGIQPYEDVLLLLRKMFGIDARNWVHGHIDEARRILSKKMEVYGLRDIQKLKKRLPAKTTQAGDSDGHLFDAPLSWRDLEGGVPQGA